MRTPEIAIEKQPAWAAPISSSGFVPALSSIRDWNEYGSSKAPDPNSIRPVPLGQRSVPLGVCAACRHAVAPPSRSLSSSAA